MYNLKTLTFLFIVLFAFSSCESDDSDNNDGQQSSSTFQATIDGNSYVFNTADGIYSDVTGKLVLPAFCDDCPYSLELQILDGLEPRTVSSDGTSDDASFGRILVTFHDLQFEPETSADDATITIDSHNESAQTISGSFSFSTYSSSQDYTYEGTGTFTNAYYD